MDSGITSLSGAVAWASDSESLFVDPSGWTSRTGFRARPRFTFGSKAVRRLIGSRFACGRFPPGSFRFKVRDLAPAYMTCMERTEYSPETVWSADQNFKFLVYRAMVSSSDVREPLLLRKFPSKDCLKGMRVWRPLPWVFLRAMDSGIASLSGAVAWASDSESLFVEPSGFPSKDFLKGMRVWRPLSWVFLRLISDCCGLLAMVSGIASLSGAIAWASDSESLFVEPSGVL
ncbi:hypothetical protein F2Q70_00005267 [Brassica cretica]|uniref:Uncharacterized protein n=1 Tax=Brassica cretica TaxID=69181 RepID=A0A8S9IXS7_BRACR|nr:hypothetical protein F2Q70_00005267 [Brassica cretica]